MGIADLSDLILKFGFGTVMAAIGLFVIYKFVVLTFKNKEKKEDFEFQHNRKLTDELLKDKKTQSELSLEEKKAANELLTRERQELKDRLSHCEEELKHCNEYIRNKLTGLLEENIKTFQQVNTSIGQINENITLLRAEGNDLRDKIGRIKEIVIDTNKT